MLLVHDAADNQSLEGASALERARISGLLIWRARWQPDGPWQRLLEYIHFLPPDAAFQAMCDELQTRNGLGVSSSGAHSHH